jgi:hypothetical protein
VPSTTGMKPGGFYDEHSSGQRSSIEILLPWVEAAYQVVLAGGGSVDMLGAIGSTGAPGETSFKPAMPAMISATQANREVLADSPNAAMPTSTVPRAPVPVQTA